MLRRDEITLAEQIGDNVKFDSYASLEETDWEKKIGPFLEKSRSVTVEQCETATANDFLLDKTGKVENMFKQKSPLTYLWDL